MNKITPCLWFDTNAQEAVAFYLSIFPDSRIVETTRYPRSAHPAHAGRDGKVMVISFELCGQRYSALNGGPYFRFTRAAARGLRADRKAP